MPSVDDTNVTAENKALTANASHGADARCTSGCTSERENDNATAEIPPAGDAANDAMPEQGEADDTLAVLAAALLDLPAKDRIKLAALLASGKIGTGDKMTDTGNANAASKAKRTTKRPARKGDV